MTLKEFQDKLNSILLEHEGNEKLIVTFGETVLPYEEVQSIEVIGNEVVLNFF